MFVFRPGTLDSYIFYKVVHQNEYRLPDDLSKFVVVDIGAHIGSFTIACLQRNAKFVFAYEAHPENYEIAKENIFDRGKFKNVELYNMAVWSHGDDSPKELSMGNLTQNTGQISVGINDSVYTIPTISLDEIVLHVTNKHYGKIDLLKIDCEGSEYPILYTTTSLYSFKNIIGEYHELHPNHEFINTEDIHFLYNGDGLKRFLKINGFMVKFEYLHKAGNFFGVRDTNTSPFLIDIEEFEVNHIIP
jgi:FkbM family methyltransferase